MFYSYVVVEYWSDQRQSVVGDLRGRDRVSPMWNRLVVVMPQALHGSKAGSDLSF